MRLGAISDLHVDHNARRLGLSEAELIQIIARALRRLDLDALVIAGDVADGFRRSLALQEELLAALGSDLARNTRFIPGNHCLWAVDDESADTWKAYRTLCAQPWALPTHPLVLGEWRVIGDTGWYPLSSRRSDIDPVDWSQAPDEPLTWMRLNLAMQMDRYTHKRLIIATHFVPFTQCIAPQFQGRPINRYFVVPEIGDLILDRDDLCIDAVICGHTHVRQRLTVRGIPTFCCPLGYRQEWESSDPEQEVLRAAAVLHLTSAEASAQKQAGEGEA